MPKNEQTLLYLKRAGLLLLGAIALLIYMKDISSRLYWPYMLSAYVIAVLGYIQEVQNRPVGDHLRLIDYLFPKEVWTHHSTLNDFAVSIINFLLVATVFNFITFGPAEAFRVLKALGHDIQAGQVSHLAPGFGLLIGYTLLSISLSELFYYISHRMTHEIPMLWEFHKVHHSAEVMTPLTLYRMHPFDFWLNMVFRGFGLSIAAVVFTYFFPGKATVLMVANVNILVFLTNFFGANLRHSHVWISFGPWVEHFFLSPAQHQIHHSDNPKHFDKNFGSLLSIWDWMFGSLYVPKEREKIVFGLGSQEEQAPYQTVWNLYVYPIKQAYARLRGKI